LSGDRSLRRKTRKLQHERLKQRFSQCQFM
jgi:hypothetical protein